MNKRKKPVKRKVPDSEFKPHEAGRPNRILRHREKIIKKTEIR